MSTLHLTMSREVLVSRDHYMVLACVSDWWTCFVVVLVLISCSVVDSCIKANIVGYFSKSVTPHHTWLEGLAVKTMKHRK